MSRVSIAAASLVLVLLLDSPALACDPPRICASGADINAAADAACRRARAAELQLTQQVLPDLQAAQTQRDQCRGEVSVLTRQLEIVTLTPPVRTRSPWVLRVGLDVVAAVLGGAAGVSLGADGPPQLTAGVGVAAVTVLVGRLLVEWLDDRQPKRARP